MKNTINWKEVFLHWKVGLCSINNPVKLFPALKYFFNTLRDYQMQTSEKIHFSDHIPCLIDSVRSTPFDAHYLFQANWAGERIINSNPSIHVDIGSDIRFLSLLALTHPVFFLDVRPVSLQLMNFTSLSGDILALPFRSNSVKSLSCLHVAEHIGLGRYGDAINPQGTQQACEELARSLAPGGNLFFSLPIGQPKVCFNAHRVHSVLQICDYFHSLTSVEISLIDDRGKLLINPLREMFEKQDYGCGLFWFTKEQR